MGLFIYSIIIIINIYLNFLLLALIEMIDNSRNLFLISIQEDCKNIKNQKNLLGKLFLISSYLFNFIDIFYNLLKLTSCSIGKHIKYCNCYNNLCNLCKSKKINDYLTDILIIFYLILLILIYTFFKYQDAFIFSLIIIWRITAILIFKIRELTNMGIGIYKNIITSFPRSLLILTINFIEIILGFSYLNYYFKIYELSKNRYEAILDTLLFFITIKWDYKYMFITQKHLLLFQIITYFIFILVFITNIANLRRNET